MIYRVTLKDEHQDAGRLAISVAGATVVFNEELESDRDNENIVYADGVYETPDKNAADALRATDLVDVENVEEDEDRPVEAADVQHREEVEQIRAERVEARTGEDTPDANVAGDLLGDDDDQEEIH